MRAGLATIIFTERRWWQQLCKARQQCSVINEKDSPVTIALLMIIIIATPTTILQPALGTATTNLSTNTTTTTDTEYNFFILVPLNQSSTSSADKTNVTLRGLFNVQVDPGRWN